MSRRRKDGCRNVAGDGDGIYVSNRQGGSSSPISGVRLLSCVRKKAETGGEYNTVQLLTYIYLYTCLYIYI